MAYLYHITTLLLVSYLPTLYGELSAPVLGNDPLLNSLPVFVQQPEEHYYVVKNKPVTITCKAMQVVQIIFKCAGQWVRAKHHVNLELIDPVTGVKYLQTSIDVMREEVEEYFGVGGYWCECQARNHVRGTNQPGAQISRRGLVQIAYLKKRFEREPISTRVEMESTAQLLCLPPEGLPLPQVFWLKDGETIDVKKEINYIISNEGNLIINQARLTDMGNYTCGAANVVSKRLSESALLTVYVNGGWSTWSVWSECSAKCGKGTQRRSRTCTNPGSVNGGSNCDGDVTQKISCTSICPVDGIWSTWSSWSTCSPDCIHHRRRSCDEPRPNNGGDYCSGNDLDSKNCTNGMCRNRDQRHMKSTHAQNHPGASKKDDVENIALYVGLCVAFAVLVTAVVIIIFLVRRKHYHQPGVYDMDLPNSDSHLPPLDSEMKKVNKQTQDMVSVQPDLTQTVVSVRNHNSLDSPNSPNNNHISSTCSKENLPTYAEIMTPANRHSGTLGKGSKTVSVEPTLNHNLKNSVEKLTIKDKASMKASPSESRPLLGGEGEVANRLSLVASKLPSNVDIDAVVWNAFDCRGGRLSLPESAAGVCLTIPDGAIRRGHTEEMFMAICRDDKDRPKLTDKQTILSPIVFCGPTGAVFKKPVILSIQHCASMRQGGWILSVYTSVTPADEAPQWQKTVTLGQETINTPIYSQLDPNHCHIMTEQLQRYAVIGESVPGSRAIKVLRLAAFAPATPPSMDYNIRVYVIEDTQDALESVFQVERKLGGRVLDKPKQILFQDGGNNLCLTIEELSFGWRSKLAANYQEIPFRHIWSGNQNSLHCSFSLEMIERAQQDVTCVIQVYQKAILNNRQVLHITSCLKDPPSTPSGHSTLRGKSSAVSANSNNCFGSMATVDSSKPAFRLPSHVRAQLCLLLDPPNARGNDWRMLAQALTVDRYINYFATKTSPTDHILDLWEARHREESAVTDLMNILRVMGRLDASAALEKDMGAWL